MSVPSGRGRHLPPGSTASSLSSSSTSTSAKPAHTPRSEKSARQPAATPAGVETKARHSVAGGQPMPPSQAEPLLPMPRPLRDRKVQAQAASSTTTTSSPALPRPALSDLARSIVQRESCAQDTRQLFECETELQRLGPKLKRPLDARVVEGLADRVINALNNSSKLNLAPLMQTLVVVLDGPHIELPALCIIFNRLLDAHPRLKAQTFTGGVLALVAGLGAATIQVPQREALLQCLLERLDTTPTPDQRLADAVVAALAARPLGHTFLDPIAACAVAAGGTGSVAARTCLLQALSHALGPLHDHADRGAAYLALVREAAPLDPAMISAIGGQFHLREMSAGADGEANLLAWFASLTGWAVTLDDHSGVSLLTGACAGLWDDTDFTPRQWLAAVRGVRSVEAPGREASVIGVLTGFVSEGVRQQWIHAEHVEAFLDLLPVAASTPQQEGQARQALTMLCRVIAHHEWPQAITEALIGGVLARAPGWPSDRVVEAGRDIGQCLSRLDRQESLFTQTLARMAKLHPLDRAARLLGGFAAGLSPDYGDATALAALGCVIAQPGIAGTVRALALGGAIATGLNASVAVPQETPGTQATQGAPQTHAWRAPLQALAGAPADHKGGTTTYAPLLAGLDLLESPVQATLASGLPRAQQQELLEFAWTELAVATPALMQRQVEHLRDADFHGDELARGDLLLALFQHSGRVAGGKTFLGARDILARAIQRLDLPAAGEGKASAAAAHPDTRDALRSQLEALYRYYITASAPPSYVWNPPAGEVIKRLQWLESLHAGSPQKVSDGEREMLRAMHEDYAHLLALQPVAVPGAGHPPAG